MLMPYAAIDFFADADYCHADALIILPQRRYFRRHMPVCCRCHADTPPPSRSRLLRFFDAAFIFDAAIRLLFRRCCCQNT